MEITILKKRMLRVETLLQYAMVDKNEIKTIQARRVLGMIHERLAKIYYTNNY